jgi:hypothetical protein
MLEMREGPPAVLLLGRHPERSRFSGGAKDLARIATEFNQQVAPSPTFGSGWFEFCHL